jgi:hypothetical protein
MVMKSTVGFIVVMVICATPMAGASDAEELRYNCGEGYVEVTEGGHPVLRYDHDSTAPPEGIGAEFARGDYISALYGLHGELLTEDYPQDHAHHRAVNWSWATIRWNGEERDLFAVRGIWARPVGEPRVNRTGGAVEIVADSVWQWDDATPVVSETVTIRVWPREDQGRAVDIDLRLAATVEGLEFCGRLEAGYSGFNVRMAPAPGQAIVFHTDPADASPRRAWADYSAEFDGGNGRSGLTLLQCAGNPGYPQEWREYPQLNFFQPIYPGGQLIPMAKDAPVRLRYRLWIHRGGADEAALTAAWDAYGPQNTREGVKTP